MEDPPGDVSTAVHASFLHLDPTHRLRILKPTRLQDWGNEVLRPDLYKLYEALVELCGDHAVHRHAELQPLLLPQVVHHGDHLHYEAVLSQVVTVLS